MIKALSISLLGAIIVSASATASAATPAAKKGNWQFDPRRCPDLVEDYRDRRESRRDERYDRNRRDVIEDRLDRRESRRDERVTVCPSSAWVWKGNRYNAKFHPARPSRVKVYYNPGTRVYFRNSGKRRVVINF